MRAVTSLALIALLVLASMCSASMLRSSILGKLPKRVGAKGDKGATYGLVAQLVAALHYKNYTQAASLLSDDGAFIITDLGCDVLNKTQLLDAAMNEHLAASQVILGDWVETDGGATVIRAQVGAIFDANSPIANQTYYNPSVFLFAYPNEDGTRLLAFERFSDATWRQQNNASDMLHVWNTILAADEVADIKPWRQIISPNMTFVMHYAWGEFAPIFSNATSFLSTLTTEYANQKSATVKVATVFPVCDFVLGSIMAFKQTKDNRAMVQKFSIALAIDENFKLLGLDEYAMTYY